MKYYQSIVIKNLTPCPAIKLNFWTLKYHYLKRTKTYQLKCFLYQLTRKNSGKRYSYTEKPLDHQICLKAKDIWTISCCGYRVLLCIPMVLLLPSKHFYNNHHKKISDTTKNSHWQNFIEANIYCSKFIEINRFSFFNYLSLYTL